MAQQAEPAQGGTTHAFFAMLDRMRHIQRWSLMRSLQSENLAEHTLMVAVLGHALGCIRNSGLAGALSPAVSPDRVAVRALFHDVPEILTGDLPTPIKYFDADIRSAYQRVEHAAVDRLLSFLPAPLSAVYRPLLPGDAGGAAAADPSVQAAAHQAPSVQVTPVQTPSVQITPVQVPSVQPGEPAAGSLGASAASDETAVLEQRLVKAADTLSAYLKCLQEVAGGNAEFKSALRQTRARLDAMDLPECRYFLTHFADGFVMTIDELNPQSDIQPAETGGEVTGDAR